MKLNKQIKELKEEIEWIEDNILPSLINESGEAIRESEELKIRESEELKILQAKLETLEEVKKEIEKLIEHRDNERKNNNIFRKSSDENNEDFIKELKSLLGDEKL